MKVRAARNSVLRKLQKYRTISKSDDSNRDRTWPLPKVTTVTEIVPHHFQKWRQLQRSYLTTSKSDDSYRDRTWPLPKVTDSYRDRTWPLPKVTTVTEIVLDHFQKWPTVTKIVLDHFQKWRQLQRSYLTTSKSDDSYRDRTSPLPKVTTVTEIVLDHFQKRRQLQRSYLTTSKSDRQLQRSYFTTSKSDDSYRDRTWPLPKVTTVTEIVIDHFQKWRQLQRSYLTTSKSDDSCKIVLQRTPKVTTVTEIIAKSKLSCETSFKNESPKSIFDDSHTGQARGKTEAKAGWTRRFAELTFDVGAAHFSLQNTAFREPAIYPNHISSCKNDNSHRDRTSPLPKATTVTEIVLDHFPKWRQLQRSSLTTSKSDDSYRDRTWPLPKVTTVTEIVLNHFQKWRQSQRSSPNRSFRARLPSKRISKVNFWRQSHEASPRQARGRLNPPFRGPYFRRRSSALFLAKHSISRAGYLPKSYFKLQKWQQSQRSYLTTSKSDDSYRDRTSPLPKVTTVTEIVPHHFQKWRQLQRSYLTTSKSDDSCKIVLQRTPKVTTVTEIIAKSKLSCETSFKNESPKSIFDDSHTGQARGKPAASPRQAEPAVSRTLLSTSEQRTFPCKTQHFASRLSTQIILQVAKMTTVTEIVLHHFQKWRQLQRSYLTTSKSDDSYRDRTSPLPKVTTVTEILAKTKLLCVSFSYPLL